MSFQTRSVSFANTVQVALTTLESLDTPRSLAVYLLARDLLLREYNPVAFKENLDSLTFRPDSYGSSPAEIRRCAADYQATSLLSKLPSKHDKDRSLAQKAIDSFFKDEEKNSITNQSWLNESRMEHLLARLDVSLDDLKATIKKVLGRCPSLQKLADNGAWTGGSSVLLPLTKSNQADKCERGISVTYPLAKALCDGYVKTPLINDRTGWFLVPGNQLDTVPKNIGTDRTIAKEPEINAFYQRALGCVIAKRLKSYGIDLQDQTLNQRACERAIREILCTIDLKSASNSVTWGLIQCLFPPDWVDLLFLLRSPYGTLSSRKQIIGRKAEWFEYSMLSSMGNGFTFEVESLLFFSICIACGSPIYDTYVYGDDIIIPQRLSEKVIGVLSICGFSVNLEKSFTEGAFFESCGVYTFNGVDVSPFKIKDLLYGNKERIVLANKIRWAAHIRNFFNGCDRRLLRPWKSCIDGLSLHVRSTCRGPLGSGLLLHMNRNECPNVALQKQPKKNTKPYYGLLVTNHLVPSALESNRKVLTAEHIGLMKLRISEIGKSDQGYGNTVRTEFLGKYSVSRLYIHINDWYDFGTWQ